MRRVILAVGIAFAIVLLVAVFWTSGPDIPDPGVLVIELSGELEEAPPVDALAEFTASGPALPTLILQLDKAAADDRIVGVLLHVRPLALGYASVQELRDAVTRVRDAGKRVVVLLDLATLNATRELYLASAADRIYAMPGMLGPLIGIAGQVLSFGGLLEKGGIDVEYERIGEYKTAPEQLAGRRMSPAARRQLGSLLDGLFEQIVSGIAEGRGIERGAVIEAIDRAPATAEEYLASDLADGIAHRGDVLALAGLEKIEEVELSAYAQVDPHDLDLRNGPRVALIFAEGTIVQEEGRGLRRSRFSADGIADAIHDAVERDDVSAFVLRVNTGGGSSLASDQLWRAVHDATRTKPVVVSMADAAASGGYYVASGADAIVAHPATLTGSIGIFFTRFVLRDLYQKLDVGAEVVARGRHAALATSTAPMTPESRERARHFVRVLYGEFLDRVSRGRGMSLEEVDKLGQGQVWLGDVARAKGLVDENGGLHAAVARAKREAGIEPEIDPERIILPGPRSLAEQVQELLGAAVSTSWHDLLPVRLPDVARAWLDFSEEGIAYLPPWWVELR
jgi:protease-4